MTQDFMADTLPDNFSFWGPYALAHPESMQITNPDTYSGYAFTGLIRTTPAGPRFLVAAYEFSCGEIDPRDINPIAPESMQATVTRISCAERPCGTQVAFLQLESTSRFYHQPWMVVASTPEWIQEQLRGIHGDTIKIEILDATDIDWTESFQHPWFQL